MNLDRSLLDPPAQKSALVDKPPPSPMHASLLDNNSNSSSNILGAGSGMMDSKSGFGNSNFDDGANKENASGMGGLDSPTDDSEGDPPAVVIYMVDPFSFGVDNCDMLRLCNLALMRCFNQILPSLNEPLRNNVFLQIVSLESIFELSQTQAQARMPSMVKGLAFSVYSQTQRALQYTKDCKTLTGFGPASAVERYLKVNDSKAKLVSQLYQPAFVLAPPPIKKKSTDSDSFGSSNERSSVLFVNYCLSEDQHWLLASACDDRGELVKTVVINTEIPNKTRRKKASARRVGLKKLFDWILSVMAMSLVPWRLVVGRIGRIGHGELRGTLRHLQISLVLSTKRALFHLRLERFAGQKVTEEVLKTTSGNLRLDK
jgi:mediator of RNA polymerase II transcription subunit 13